jgi:hypothetical protein
MENDMDMERRFQVVRIDQARQYVEEKLSKILYAIRASKDICLQLDKLDRIPLDEAFDFRKYLNEHESIYLGKPSPIPYDE